MQERSGEQSAQKSRQKSRDTGKGGLEPTDLQLIRRSQQGEAAAFHALVDRFADPMYRLAFAMIGHAADAEDVVQETFAGAYKSLSRFEERASVKTWLSRILVNQVKKFRRDRPMPMRSLDSGSDGESEFSIARESSGVVRGPSPAVAGGEPQINLRLDLATKLARLSDEHREVIVLREFEQLSYEEIAQVLGVPRGTVESRLHRARAELREKLADYLP